MKTCKRNHQYDLSLKQCPVCHKEQKRQYREENKEQRKQYRKENKEQMNQYQKQYRKENKEYLNQCQKKYTSKRLQADPLFKLRSNIRNLVNSALKRHGHRKTSKTQTIVGCDFAALRSHLIQSAIANYGFYLYDEIYHIDHIIPVSSTSSEEELLKLNHYSNLQYLYPHDNFSKSDNMSWTPQLSKGTSKK